MMKEPEDDMTRPTPEKKQSPMEDPLLGVMSRLYPEPHSRSTGGRMSAYLLLRRDWFKSHQPPVAL